MSFHVPKSRLDPAIQRAFNAVEDAINGLLGKAVEPDDPEEFHVLVKDAFTGTITFNDGDALNHEVEIQDGIITSWTKT